MADGSHFRWTCSQLFTVSQKLRAESMAAGATLPFVCSESEVITVWPMEVTPGLRDLLQVIFCFRSQNSNGSWFSSSPYWRRFAGTVEVEAEAGAAIDQNAAGVMRHGMYCRLAGAFTILLVHIGLIM